MSIASEATAHVCIETAYGIPSYSAWLQLCNVNVSLGLYLVSEITPFRQLCEFVKVISKHNCVQILRLCQIQRLQATLTEICTPYKRRFTVRHRRPISSIAVPTFSVVSIMQWFLMPIHWQRTKTRLNNMFI